MPDTRNIRRRSSSNNNKHIRLDSQKLAQRPVCIILSSSCIMTHLLLKLRYISLAALLAVCTIASHFHMGRLSIEDQATFSSKSVAIQIDVASSDVPPLVDRLLSVPFYVYTDMGLPEDGTIDGEPFTMKAWHEGADSGFDAKHADDLFLAEASLQHPMRTRNPEEAKLFFVPSPLNYISSLVKRGGNFCFWNGTVCNQDVVKHVDRYLGDSRWFQRNNGTDHVIVASHWVWNTPKIWTKRYGNWTAPNIHDCGMITMENKCRLCTKERIRFPSYYVGTGCNTNEISNEKWDDFAMIANIRKGVGEIEARRNLCQWIQEERSNLFRMSLCGEGTQCPALAQAKFGFHVRGDTWGANRPMDTMLSGSVPVFTQNQQYGVLPKWIDWEHISQFANIENKDSFIRSLTTIVNDTEQYEQIRQNVLDNQALFDYRNHADMIFDTYMYMFQINLWPELWRNVTTKYTALIVDERLLTPEFTGWTTIENVPFHLTDPF